MLQKIIPQKSSSYLANFVVLLFLLIVIYGVVAFAQQMGSGFRAQAEISLDLNSLPLYSFFSSLRGVIAYLFSLSFTLVIGYWAAKSRAAEKILIPFLDIMQSIPVLGFLPGLVLGLVSIFPNSNWGLEIASIIMIFTGQVWNMTFAFYSSLKSVPNDLNEAAAMIGFSPLEKLVKLELPYSALNLTWNSVMSMAGGWFFLSVCEAFTLGDQKFQLPGLGSYMALAIEKGDGTAMFFGVVAMFVVILVFDIILWRPVLYLANKYRLEDGFSTNEENSQRDYPLINVILKKSLFVDWFQDFSAFLQNKKNHSIKKLNDRKNIETLTSEEQIQDETRLNPAWTFIESIKNNQKIINAFKVVLGILGLSVFAFVLLAIYNLGVKLSRLEITQWLEILSSTFFTLLRVFGAVTLATLWTAPFGVWVCNSPQRLSFFRPIIQLLASFPAPMLYPVALSMFIYLNISFEISSMLLMFIGVQWYVLFNVLSGALRIPQELKMMTTTLGLSRWHQWRFLIFPSLLPFLATGWLNAAGGAWNASIVAEVVRYRGAEFTAHGIGALIFQATESGEFEKLAACLIVMVTVLILLNHQLWGRIYRLSQTRFKVD